jgi:hypothetical protein
MISMRILMLNMHSTGFFFSLKNIKNQSQHIKLIILISYSEVSCTQMGFDNIKEKIGAENLTLGHLLS